MSRPNNEWFEYATTADALMVAVARVYKTYSEGGGKPASERWVTNQGFFDSLRLDIMMQWVKITGLDEWRFPFTDDYIRWAWLTFRKDSGTDGELFRWAQGQQPSLFV